LKLNIDAMVPDRSSIPAEPVACPGTVRLQMLAAIEHLQRTAAELDGMPPSVLGMVKRRMDRVVQQTHQIDRMGARFGRAPGPSGNGRASA
jgi:hypothetical protein